MVSKSIYTVFYFTHFCIYLHTISLETGKINYSYFVSIRIFIFKAFDYKISSNKIDLMALTYMIFHPLRHNTYL